MTRENVLIEDAKLWFRNFSGKESRFNAAGIRNFCVMLPNDLAERMIADGWNVRKTNPDEGDGSYFISICASCVPTETRLLNYMKVGIDVGISELLTLSK